MSAHRYFRMIRKHGWVVALVSILCLAAAVGVTLHATPMYSSSTSLFVSTHGGTSDAGSAYQSTLFSQERVTSYANLAQSRRLAKAVQDNLRLSVDVDAVQSAISAAPVPETVLLRISAVDPRPEQAAALANSAARSLITLVNVLERQRGRPVQVDLSIVDEAEVPTSPVSPRPLRTGVLALVIGVLLGGAVAALREVTDTSAKTPEELAEIAGVPTLATVPRFARGARPFAGGLAQGEAYRQLRTNLRFLGVDRTLRSVVLTSAVSGEGKTTTVCNLARAWAAAGVTVALVDADLRRPHVAEYLGLEGAVGLTDVLIGTVDLDSALQDWGEGQFLVLPAGTVPPNPSELLGSTAMHRVLQELTARVDIVLLDAPPLLPVTDAALLTTMCSGALLVVRARSTSADEVRRTVSALRRVDAHILGTILNGLPQHGRDGYGSHYGSYTSAAVQETAASVPMPVPAARAEQLTPAPVQPVPADVARAPAAQP